MSKTLFFTTCDNNNFKYAVMFWQSITKFHSSKDIDMVLWTTETRPEELAKLPKGIKVENLDEYLKYDPNFWYRQKPILMSRYFEDGYSLVCGYDADQIVTGDLNEILESRFDVAVVHNWNRVDPKVYGEIGLATIYPIEYFNCGLVAVRNPEFIKQWKKLCFSMHFDRMPFREQGFLNLLAHYGDFNVKPLDLGDSLYGLASKGEWDKCVMRDGLMVLPKSDYPSKDKVIRVIHWAGGNNPVKMNYKVYFNQECCKYLDSLIKNGK